MLEDFGPACKNFQDLAVDLVGRLQSQTPCTDSGQIKYIDIMYDQSEAKRRILLPTTPLTDEFPTGASSPPAMPVTPDFHQHASFRENVPRNFSQGLDRCGETVAFPYAGLQQDQNTVEQSRGLIFTAPYLPQSTGPFFVEVSSPAAGEYHYEDTDDLDAILGCSDEEVSYSIPPSSELTGHIEPPQENAGPCELFPRKRRYEREEEVNSRCYKRRRSEEELEDEVDDICHEYRSYSSSVSVADGFSGDSLCPSYVMEYEDDYAELDESALELQMLCDDTAFDMTEEHQCSSCNEEKEEEGVSFSSGSARKSRRDKIKKTVKHLRDIIPGTGCMDTAVVLDEAIHYVKLLQLQVQTLEAKRLVGRSR